MILSVASWRTKLSPILRKTAWPALTTLVIAGVSLAFAQFALNPKFSLAKAAAAPNPNSSCCSNHEAGLGAQSEGPTDIVSIKAGTTLDLIIAADGWLAPGGVWSAELGSIDQEGHYTAPAYMPPQGLDKITYWDPANRVDMVEVRIVPNPDIPGSENPRFFRVPEGCINAPPILPYREDGQYEQPDSYPGAGLEGPMIPEEIAEVLRNSDEAWVLLEPDDEYAPPVEVWDCEDAAVVVFVYESQATSPRSGEGYLLPSTESHESIYALHDPDKEKPKICKVGPYNTPPPRWVNEPCTGSGTRNVDSAKKYYKRPDSDWMSRGSITITRELSASILRLFGLRLDVGLTLTVTGRSIRHTVVFTRDVYVCRNGGWVFSHREACESNATGWEYDPIWFFLVTGQPPGGGPGTWSTFRCNRTN